MTPNHERLRVILQDRPLSYAARRIRLELPPQRISDHLAGQKPSIVFKLYYADIAGLPLADWATKADRAKVRKLKSRWKEVRR
jgi:hypothetical protein